MHSKVPHALRIGTSTCNLRRSVGPRENELPSESQHRCRVLLGVVTRQTQTVNHTCHQLPRHRFRAADSSRGYCSGNSRAAAKRPGAAMDRSTFITRILRVHSQDMQGSGGIPVASVSAATAVPPQSLGACLQAWSATTSRRAWHN